MATLTLEAGQTIQGVAGTAGVIACLVDGVEKDVTTGANVYKQLAAQAFVAAATAVLATVTVGKSWLYVIHLQNTSGIPVSGIIIYAGGANPVNQLTGRFTMPAYGKTIISAEVFQTVDVNGVVTSGSSTASKNYAARVFARQAFR